MKKSLFYLILFLSTLCFSQDGGEFNYATEINRMTTTPTSPEASAFGTYGETSVNLVLGKPNISIPLYTFKGLEMDLPISLTYDIDNRKVEDIASGVGMGWNLALGGMVTRNTNGQPDTFITVTGGSSFATLFSSTSLRSKYAIFKDKDLGPSGNKTFANQAEALDYLDFLDRVQTGSYDVALDSYSLNAPGLSANVVVVFDESTNTVKPMAIDNPRIKFTSYGESTWYVTNENGAVYIFGEGEVTHNTGANDTFSINQMSHAPYTMSFISSWVLTKIISPNGKDEYEFFYEDLDDWDEPFLTWYDKRIDNEPPPTDPNNWIYYDEINSNSSYYIEQKALSYVTHNGDTIVDITLGLRSDFDQENKIESIEVKSPYSSGSTINFFKFTYDYFGTGTNQVDLRLKLDKIEITGNGYTGTSYNFEKEYNFTYDNPDDMPERDSFSQDRWGFYNGASNGTNLFEEWDIGSHTLPGADRDFSFSDALIGILTRIDYPTGGYTEFAYGQHKKTVGGVDTFYDGIRIDSITNYTDTGDFATKKAYEYEELYEEAYVKPVLKYQTTELRDLSGTNTFYRYHRLAKVSNSGTIPYITYGKVTEKDLTSTGSTPYGKTVYEFKTGHFNGTLPFNYAPFAKNYYSEIGQGQLKKETASDLGNNSLTSKEISYTSDENTYYSYSVKDEPSRAYMFIDIVPTGNGSEVEANYTPAVSGMVGPEPPSSCTYCPPYLSYGRIQPFKTNIISEYIKTSTQVSKQIFGTDEVTTTVTSEYDDLGDVNYLLRKTTTSSSKSGEEKITKYYYPDDFDTTDTDMNLLKTANRLSTPVKVEYWHKEGSTEELKYTQETKYDEFGSSPTFLVPDSIEVFRQNDTAESRLDFREYDPNGNLCEVAKAGGHSTSYIWGYGGRLLVAKVENVTYDQIEALAYFGSGFTLPGALGTQQETQLRGLANALVTTYTYTNYMLIKTINDTRSYKTTFHYDGENRFLYATDEAGKVLSSNEYNYRVD